MCIRDSLETISGGCDCDTHQRRMRTKLIAMAMRGFDRVVVEPLSLIHISASRSLPTIWAWK